MEVDGIDAVLVDGTSLDVFATDCVAIVSPPSVNGSTVVIGDDVICLTLCDVLAMTRSTPGTIAAGTGGVAGSGDIGSRVGKSGGRTSGNLL